ncbi:uncharacterized protein STEHIDRAFT_108180 [Stereum hirsutum FP-91666 SS1]|uniref:uncharacterized protein n=1 Tax=Stereum hirsutum (strain FP-91666) TaxID=721885 RepID=UPI000440A1C1|nr:uncharacterized protein STEHIDRAFT_108180 [Stereum hirsutum FP-91666 SS1]EIM89442.1 hypothetical protein STEHIDRAFT_108180 [Stereum hirsutum FP-91666 SS1]
MVAGYIIVVITTLTARNSLLSSILGPGDSYEKLNDVDRWSGRRLFLGAVIHGSLHSPRTQIRNIPYNNPSPQAIPALGFPSSKPGETPYWPPLGNPSPAPSSLSNGFLTPQPRLGYSHAHTRSSFNGWISLGPSADSVGSIMQNRGRTTDGGREGWQLPDERTTDVPVEGNTLLNQGRMLDLRGELLGEFQVLSVERLIVTVGELESPSARGKKRILRILFRSGTVTVWGIHECTATHLIKPSEMSLTLSFSLSLPTGASQSLPLITMPIEEPARFSLKGAKWLLFLAGCIYGDFDGHLSLSSAGDAIDYDAPLHATTYHFVSDKQPRFLDPKLTDARTSDKSATPRTGAFRDELLARDGHCLLNDTKPVNECDAAHLLPHAKGDDYITAATAFRSDNEEVIENIDDPRNGFFLAKELHIHLGLGHMAFLMVHP